MRNCKRIKFIRDANINSQTFLNEKNMNQLILITANTDNKIIKTYLRFFPKIKSLKEIKIKKLLKIYLLKLKK